MNTAGFSSPIGKKAPSSAATPGTPSQYKLSDSKVSNVLLLSGAKKGKILNTEEMKRFMDNADEIIAERQRLLIRSQNENATLLDAFKRRRGKRNEVMSLSIIVE